MNRFDIALRDTAALKTISVDIPLPPDQERAESLKVDCKD
jgi:hypothetical protein